MPRGLATLLLTALAGALFVYLPVPGIDEALYSELAGRGSSPSPPRCRGWWSPTA